MCQTSVANDLQISSNKLWLTMWQITVLITHDFRNKIHLQRVNMQTGSGL